MSRNRRRITASSALVGILVTTLACGAPVASPGAPTAIPGTPGGTTTPSASSPETSPDQPEEATIRLAMHWTTPEVTHSGMMTALALGYYEEENVNVEFQWLQGSAAAVQQVGAGTADLGVAGSDTILGGLAEDLPLIVVANHLQQTPTGVIYPSDRQLTSFSDLEGLRVATSQVGPEAPTLISRLQEEGLDPESDVDLVYVDPQAKCSTMLTGGADACTGFNTFQLLQVRQEDEGAGFLSFSTDERPLLGHSIFANTSYAEQNGDVIRRFLHATARGFAEADKDLDQATDYVLEEHPEGVDREFFRAGMDIMHGELIRSERTEANGWGWMEDEPWQNLQNLLLDGGVLSTETPVNEIYTTEYLPEDVDF